MGAEKRVLSIKEAFQLAQKSHQNQAKLVVALSRTYVTVSTPDPGPGPPPPLTRPQGPPLTLQVGAPASLNLPDLGRRSEARRPRSRGHPIFPQRPQARTVNPWSAVSLGRLARLRAPRPPTGHRVWGHRMGSERGGPPGHRPQRER